MYKEVFTEIEQVRYYLQALESHLKTGNQESPDYYYTAGVLTTKISQLSVEMIQKGIVYTRNKYNPIKIPTCQRSK